MASRIAPRPMPPKAVQAPKTAATGLRRRAPMKRSGINRCKLPAATERALLAGKLPPRWGGRQKPMKRTRLRKVSTKKAQLRELYLLALAFLIRINPLCRCCGKRPATEGHHPLGQIGWLILIFFPFCRVCHQDKEDHKNRARKEGWILY